MSNVWQWDNFITPEKRARLEQLLQTEFSYHQLLFLIYDHFQAVYQGAAGDDQAALARRLVDYAAKHQDTKQNLSYLHGLLQSRCLRAYKKYQADFNWQQAAMDYRAKVQELYGKMQVLGMSEAMPLADIFTDAYILDKVTAARRHGIDELRSEFETLHYGYTRYNGLDLVKEKERLFILGKPGAGKTTFLKYVVSQACKEGGLDKIPIFISLKAWSDEKIELLPFLVKQFEICNFPNAQLFIEQVLKSKKAIVLFDGLDEVNQEGKQRAQMVKWLTDFSRQYPCPCLITCRIAASDYTFEAFNYVELADFNEAQISTFVDKWFKADPERLAKFRAQFYQPDNDRLRELARTPLLLTLLCLAFAETLTFPQRRVEIYEEALDALLKKWDSSRNISRDEIYRKLSLGRKKQMFARIAAESFAKGDYFFKQSDLATQIVAYLRLLPPVDKSEDVDGEVILKAIEAQHSIFVERAHQIYSFSHLTFQEYFTAKYITENAADKKKLRTLLTVQNIANPKWREVLLMVASLLGDGDTFMAVFRERLDEFVTVDPELTRLVQWIDYHAQPIPTQNTPYLVSRLASFALALALDPISSVYHVYGFAIQYAGKPIDSIINKALSRDQYRKRVQGYDIAIIAIQGTILEFDEAIDETISLRPDLRFDFNLLYLWQFAMILTEVHPNAFFEYQQPLLPKLTLFKYKVIALSKPLQQPVLTQALSQLPLPTEHDPQTAWRKYAAELRHIMQSQRDFGHEWALTSKQADKLNDYFRANELFLRCLELAYVSDREGLKDGLLGLLPPQSKP